VIPDFEDGDNLPCGRHRCSWDELVERFGRGDARRWLCRQLRWILERAQRCGYLRVWVGGSFPTSKVAPGDLDLTFITRVGVSKDNVPAECAELLDSSTSRQRFGHDFMFCVEDYELLDSLGDALGFDKRTGKDRGMLELDLRCL